MRGMDVPIDRRSLLALASAAALGRLQEPQSPAPLGSRTSPEPQDPQPPKPRKLRQSVCRWIYQQIPLDEFCRQVAAIGITGIDLLTANEWPIPNKHGLVCTMAYGPKTMQIHHGLNRKEHHAEFVTECERLLPRIAEAGIPNMIVFSGNRDGQDDATGIANCIAGLQQLAPLAERHGVTLCLEYLNSKVDHKDYAFDRLQYGLQVVQGVGSQRVKLLFDIYHAQIMEGDVIRSIRDHIGQIGHFHTGGVPGRKDLDDTQELNYRGICRAIAATGFDGFVAHEFIPKGEPYAALRQAFATCDA